MAGRKFSKGRMPSPEPEPEELGFQDLTTQDGENYLLVAAIDFGTTYTGYAFSMKSAPDKMYMCKKWKTGPSQTPAELKTPTSVLVKTLNGTSSLEAFGADAEARYLEHMIQEEGGPSYALFRNFKMRLHSMEKLDKSVLVGSTAGAKRLKAFDLVRMTLQYIKDKIMDQMSDMGKRESLALEAKQVALTRQCSVKIREIRWVLSVPAIWSDASKRFMREAACEAGLIENVNSRQLVIALEPEAAALSCRHPTLGQHLANLKRGTIYIVVDAGGGTIDIAVHEVIDSTKAKELYPPSGGPWGSHKINDEFEERIALVLGKNFIHRFKSEDPEAWVQFMESFEIAKRNADIDKDIRFPISHQLSCKYHEHTGKIIDSAFTNAKHMSLRNGFLILKPELVTELFSDCIGSLLIHLDNLLCEAEVRKATHMMLVGGFCESPLLQKAVKRRFENRLHIIVPYSTSLAVVQGAVLFGHFTKSIESRCSPKTYGTLVWPDFDPDIHDPKYRIRLDGRIRCKNVFWPFVKTGEAVKDGETKEWTFQPSTSAQEEVVFELLSSPNPNIMYSDEKGVILIDKLSLPVAPSRQGVFRPIKVEITFGGTEIHMKAIDASSATGRVAVTKFKAN